MKLVNSSAISSGRSKIDSSSTSLLLFTGNSSMRAILLCIYSTRSEREAV